MGRSVEHIAFPVNLRLSEDDTDLLNGKPIRKESLCGILRSLGIRKTWCEGGFGINQIIMKLTVDRTRRICL